MLTEDTARSIGMSAYFPHVRRVFVDILRALDMHYGRPLMMTSTQNVNKVFLFIYLFFNRLESSIVFSEKFEHKFSMYYIKCF